MLSCCSAQGARPSSARWCPALQRFSTTVVESKLLYDNVVTDPATPYRVQTLDIDVTDGNVTLEAGQQDEYTILNWMSIVPK